MKVKVLGIQKIDYTNKSGRHITGINLHVMYNDIKTDGYSVDKFYISSNFPNIDKIIVNSDLEIYFTISVKVYI